MGRLRASLNPFMNQVSFYITFYGGAYGYDAEAS